MLLGVVMLLTGGETSRPPGPWHAQAISFVSMTVPVLLYFAACESSAARATLGKRVLGLAVGTETGGRPGFGRALARNAIKLAPWELGHTVAQQAVFAGDGGLAPWLWVTGVLAMLGPAWWIAAIALRGRAPYDAWTRTRVVRAARSPPGELPSSASPPGASSPGKPPPGEAPPHGPDADELAVLFELFEGTPRQGPGSVETTRRALAALPDALHVERVLDLGCGTGGSTLVLAAETGAHVTAVDVHAPFLATLRAHAEQRGLAGRITTRVADMADTAALGAGYDLLWAEGSAYTIGFEDALRRWRPLLRPGGCLVLTELTWFTPEPDERARVFFAAEYPDMRHEATRLEQARAAGYTVLHGFRLPADDWHAYYAGLDAPLRAARARHGEHPVLTAMQRERETHDAFGEQYGYTCLVLQLAPGPA